ncbi:type II toxin-antitoxin system RelE/ParE family toxin [Scytonema sp. UIC 10036]|uniref:type II toxin-antitoxin system RelE family toxin n=1 Tax=Scytonema sp. UIC 10036 TaxID=2304196 RepID=UPI0012DA8111|nr:type II toxin-antitoxin system RelE/ParE family toxin [Scytonema sp. UIC 10036]MUG93811.1 type II toxin-antitoxin system RelE/ParE family toxin [Scytonema sp. UIC 10036]
MNVEFRKSFEKDLGKIRDDALLQRIKAVIEEVENVENITEISNIKKLISNGDNYRIRVGDYRIGITISNGRIIFVRVLQRKDIYRYFP